MNFLCTAYFGKDPSYSLLYFVLEDSEMHLFSEAN